MREGTIFGSRRKPMRPEPEKKTERKIRNDKKEDIKFRVTVEDKIRLQIEAARHHMEEQEFYNFIAKQGLVTNKDYPSYPYEKGVYLRVKLEQPYADIVERKRIEWGIPRRKVIHRIINDYLHHAFLFKDGLE